MAKICSDLKQSKLLTTILPIESADMFWLVTSEPRLHVLTEPLSNYDRWEHYPAWSLAALIDILPNIIRKSEKMCDWYWFNLNRNPYQISYGNSLGLSGEWHDMISSPQKENLVDACVEMILKLKENNLL